MKLKATARVSNGNPRNDASIAWVSDNPAIASVDNAGLVIGMAPGRAAIRAASDKASKTVSIEVVSNNLHSLEIEPRSSNARTGDVLHFTAKAADAAGRPISNAGVRWSVSGDGASIESDGGFVAERPGTYVITAASGTRAAVASVVVSPRNVEREIEVVGHAPFKDFQAAEQWIFGNYAYVSSVWDSVKVYDVSDIERPRKVAEYSVPEAGSHNIWVEHDILCMGYYNGGGRILDVSGELRGELYRQGREIGRVWTGDPEGFRPNLPFTWGAQPHNGLIFFNDVHTGLWIVKLGKPKEKGSTTEPGQ